MLGHILRHVELIELMIQGVTEGGVGQDRSRLGTDNKGRRCK